MAWFGAKKQNYLGIDLGVGGVKLVELKNEKGRARLFTYAFTERAPGAQPPLLVDEPKAAAELLKKMAKKARTGTTRAVAGLPIASVFSSVISVPKGSDKELLESIRWQAKKLIPVPLEEMVLDFKLIPAAAEKTSEKTPSGESVRTKKEQKNVQALVTGASKTMVQKYVAVFKQAGFDLVSLETETFALIRSLIGKDRSVTMIVDIGAVRTNVIVVENGIPFIARSLDLGGSTLTKAMSKALAIDVGAAEQMKRDIKSVSTLYPDEGIPKIFEATLAPMLTELRYSMNLFAGQDEGQAGKSIEKIVLTGGSAALPALTGFFSKQLNVKTYVGDPLARVAYPEELRPVLDEIGPRFAVAIGLAMRDID